MAEPQDQQAEGANPNIPDERPHWQLRLLQQMYVHQIGYALVIGGLNIWNIAQGSPWWALWPTLVSGVVLMIHVCIVKSIVIDEEWVEDRAMELRSHSYDFDHMTDLEKRIVESDFSVVPPEERAKHDKKKAE